MKKILVALLVAMLALIATVALAENCDGHPIPDSAACEHETIMAVAQYPTCEETGKIDYICTTCGGLVDSEVVNPIGHKWDLEAAVAPGCETWGEELYVCENLGCNETMVVPLPALGHDWHFIRVYKEDTCTEIGLEYWECLRCDADKTVEVNDIEDHDWKLVATVNPTCLKDGFDEFNCLICDAHKIEVITTSGHNWSEWNIDEYPTCTKPGMKSRYCMRPTCYEANTMSVAKETVVLEPTGHLVDPNYVVVADGYATGICVKCSAVVVEKIEVTPDPEQPEGDKPSTDNGNNNGSTNKPTTNTDGVTIPATGETMNVAPFIMMLVAIVGLAVTKQKVTE